MVVSVADGGLAAGRWVAVLVDWRIAVPDSVLVGCLPALVVQAGAGRAGVV